MALSFLGSSIDRLRERLEQPRWRDLAALLAGAAVVPAFAPFGWWPLAILAPAALFRLWADCGRGRGAWRGWLFGLGMWGAGVYWIYYSLHHFGAAVAPLAALFTVLFAAGMALTLAVLGAFVCSGDRAGRGAAWYLLVLPGAWVVLEWVRSWLFTGFPWLLLGTSQVDTWLGGFAPVAGVYGVSLAVALTAGALAALPVLRPLLRVPALTTVVALWIVGMALGGQQWTRPSGLPFDAALIQGDVAQDEKFAALGESLDTYEGLTREVAGTAELVLWPETAVPTFYEQVAAQLNDFAREMAQEDTRVVTGVFTRGDRPRQYFNAIREVGPTHRQYRKQHLVPFGEYMPLRSWLAFADQYIEIPMSDISPGAPDQKPLPVGDIRLGPSVCYEAAYPGIVRAMAPGAGVLINVSNDAWFGDSTAPYQHLQIARMRALETGRPFLRATNTGITAIIDHRGQVVARGPQFAETVVQARVVPREGVTPFVGSGSMPALILAGILLLSPMAWRRLRAQAQGSEQES